MLIKREILNQVRRWLVIWPITALLPSIIFGDTHFTSMEHSGLIPPEFLKMRGMKVPFLASSFACSNMPLSALSLILVELGRIVKSRFFVNNEVGHSNINLECCFKGSVYPSDRTWGREGGHA